MSRRTVIALATAMVLASSVGAAGVLARDASHAATHAATRDATHAATRDANHAANHDATRDATREAARDGARRHRPPKTPTFEARAGSNEAGRRMPLRLRVRHGDRSLPFEVSAVIHFASGDVRVVLERRGFALAARGRVRIPRGELPGDVVVDFTVRYGDSVHVISVLGTVEAPDEDEDGGGAGDTTPTPTLAPSAPPEDPPQN